MDGANAGSRSWLARSFTAQLLAYAGLLLLVMLVLATLLSLLAARPSAEQMERSFVVIAGVAEQTLQLHPEQPARLPASLSDAGVFAVLPPGSREAATWLPFPKALRAELQLSLQRPVQLLRLPNDETALWLPSQSPEQLPFGIRFEPARSPVARSGVWVVIATASLVLLAAWWLARWLSRPLRKLSAALPALAAGAPLPELGRHAPLEIQSLATTLDESMMRLRDQTLAREQTLAEISHDLRTPLMRIALAAQMLPEGNRATQIQADVSEMDQLIGAALELARAGRDEPTERVPLAPLAERLIGSQPDWEIAIDPTLHLRAPPLALRRALENLVENARRHGQPPYAVRAELGPQTLRLVVADSGKGLGPLSPQAARQPFQRGAGDAEGTGLGLAIVDRLAAAFDAQLTLQQADGEFQAMLEIPVQRVSREQSTGLATR